MTEKAPKAEVEFPRWVYPPDGGHGKIVQTPDDVPSGWLMQPKEPGPASGERVIGQPEFPGGLGTTGETSGKTSQAGPIAHGHPADDDEDDDVKKSKKK
jgi:hypothetical protein